MTTTPNLQWQHLTAAQTNKYLTVNEALDEIDQVLTDTLQVSCTAGGTIGVSEDDTEDYARLELTGTPAAAFTLDLFERERLLVIYNNTTRRATIQTGTPGSTTIVYPYETAVVHNDGANAVTKVSSNLEAWEFAISDETTAITTGTAKLTTRARKKAKVSEIRISLATAGSTSSAFDVNDSGASIFSTTVTLDSSEKTSETAATPYVLTDRDIADDAELTFDIDTAGTGAKGAKVCMLMVPQ